MSDAFWPVFGHPGLFEPTAETVETPAGSDLYSTGSLVGVAGLYTFDVHPPLPPSVTPHADFSPVPRVDILLAALPDNVRQVTVLQISSEGTVPVRSADRAFAVGGFFVTDYEVPLGIPVSYRAEQFDVLGNSLGFTEAVTTQVDMPVGTVVIQDPLEPSVYASVSAHGEFVNSRQRRRDVAYHQIGSDTIALMGNMSLLTDLPIPVVADTEEQNRAMDEVLGRSYVLIRTMPPIRIPRCLHAVVEVVDQNIPMGIFSPFWVWPLVAQEVTRSTLGILVPTVTWQRVIDAYDTWADVIAAHPTWLDVVQNPPPEA